MPQQAKVIPIGTGLAAAGRPLSVDDAVRAALSHRAPEMRSFGNEDDMEGFRGDGLDIREAPPAP